MRGAIRTLQSLMGRGGVESDKMYRDANKTLQSPLPRRQIMTAPRALMNIKYLPSLVEVPVVTFTSNLEQRRQKNANKGAEESNNCKAKKNCIGVLHQGKP